jgi:segregation and condensation protein A
VTVSATGQPAFEVHLENFTGPLDLLLGLIAKHKLDLTEVALSRVTDEFLGHIRRLGDAWDLSQASEFLVIAATLLDLKAARLLPRGEVEDEEDVALLEARDLLFARLLQYRAYKEVGAWIAGRLATEGRRHPRAVALEERYAGLLPEVVIGIGPAAFAAFAERALAPRPTPTVDLGHVHIARVDMAAERVRLAERLQRDGSLTFGALTADADAVMVVVARFLLLLDFYREGTVAFSQASPLGELTVRWTRS